MYIMATKQHVNALRTLNESGNEYDSGDLCHENSHIFFNDTNAKHEVLLLSHIWN